uniref:RING-type domain-containing protein n=1 Tax=viral metagenome TaxID=1070528 RepID=A0A6C0JD53_9ZZZZ
MIGAVDIYTDHYPRSRDNAPYTREAHATETCNICLDNISSKNCTLSNAHNDRTVTKCGHHFHTSCFIMHITKKTTCPCCRRELNDSVSANNINNRDEPTNNTNTNFIPPRLAYPIINDIVDDDTYQDNYEAMISLKDKNIFISTLKTFGVNLIRALLDYQSERMTL